MKKIIALLLAMVMVLGMVACSSKTEPEAAPTPEAVPEAKPDPAPKADPVEQEDAPTEVETVTYFCTIGAYLDTLQAAIDEWNAGEGAEKGVCIEVTSNINDGNAANEILMQAGTFHDLSNGGFNPTWVSMGWTKDLNEIEDPELDELIASYEPYLVDGKHIVDGVLTSLPLEVVPIKLAVNTDLLEQYGYEIPKTIDEMVETSIGIYEKSGGEAYGWGGAKFVVMIRRLLMKPVVSSTGKMYWDPNTGTYDFTPFKKIIEAYAEMYQAGAVLGLDDLAIDPIRAEFSQGKVAFFTAPAYDVTVYSSQFPAQCNWTIVDFPTYEEGDAPYKGLYYHYPNLSIIAPAYDNATEAHQKAVLEAFKFLNSDELNSRIYSVGGIIPAKMEIVENTEIAVDVPQLPLMADTRNYTAEPLRPDSVIPLEGDTFEDVMLDVIHGEVSFDEAAADLNERYNAAVAAAMEDPDINMDMYIYEWSAAK